MKLSCLFRSQRSLQDFLKVRPSGLGSESSTAPAFPGCVFGSGGSALGVGTEVAALEESPAALPAVQRVAQFEGLHWLVCHSPSVINTNSSLFLEN